MITQPRLFLRGCGPAAAFCAAILARKTQLAGSALSGRIESGEHDAPLILGPEALRVLHGIGIDERDLIKAARGTYALASTYLVGDKSTTIPILSREDALDGIPLYRVCADGLGTGLETSAPAFQDLYPSSALADNDRMAHPAPPHDYQYCVVLDPAAAYDYFIRAANHYGMTSQPANPDALTLTAFELAHAEQFPDHAKHVKVSQTMTNVIRSAVNYRDIADGFEMSLTTQVCEFTLRAPKAAYGAPKANTKTTEDDTNVLQHIMSRLTPIDRLYYDTLAMSLDDFYQFWPVEDKSGMALRTIATRSARRAELAAAFQSLHWLCDERAIMTSGSDTLQRKCALYRRRGHIPLYEEEIVNASEWAMRFASLGISPQAMDPLATRLNMDEVSQRLKQRREDAQNWASQQVKQIDYLGRMGARTPASTPRRAQ